MPTVVPPALSWYKSVLKLTLLILFNDIGFSESNGPTAGENIIPGDTNHIWDPTAPAHKCKSHTNPADINSQPTAFHYIRAKVTFQCLLGSLSKERKPLKPHATVQHNFPIFPFVFPPKKRHQFQWITKNESCQNDDWHSVAIKRNRSTA